MSRNCSQIETIREAVRRLNDGDVDGYLGCFDPACLRWVAGFEDPLALDDVRENFERLQRAFESLRLCEQHLFEVGEFVCASWQLRGVHASEYLGCGATHRAIDVATCEVYEFEASLVRTTWTFADPLELFRQIGGAPALGSIQ